MKVETETIFVKKMQLEKSFEENMGTVQRREWQRDGKNLIIKTVCYVIVWDIVVLVFM